MGSSKHQIKQRHQTALAALANGNAREAHQHCLEILQSDPTFADAWFICAVIAAQNSQQHKAIEILRRAITLSPKNAEYQAELGKQLLAVNQPKQALCTALETIKLEPQDAPTLNTLGTILSHTGEHKLALQCFQKAADNLSERGSGSALTDEWRADLYFNMAAALQFSGRFDESEDAYEAAIALQFNLFKAHSALASVRKQTPDNNHLKRLDALRENITTSRDQLHLGHAIAKEQEDLEDYEASLRSLGWAKEAIASEQDYTLADDREQFAVIKRSFDRATAMQPRPHSDNREPIFIVGMPRTGTTLAEQILASHSSVFAAGELQNFPLLVKQLTETKAPDVIDLETLKAAASIDTGTLGECYIDSTRPRTGHTARFIDKLPLNFMYLGLIHQALPNAKLICLRRDPMDTCLSNYRQMFAVNFKHYHYNYDLLDCGRYYIEFDALIKHWAEAMPGVVYELQYEELVAAPEENARKLVQFCDLDWEDQCLNFHQQKSSVATASAVQVRSEIYQTSVNRWKRYGAALQPLYELLRNAGYYE